MYYTSASQLNPALCQQQSLKVYSIALSDSSTLFQPLPLFYMEPQCSAGVAFNTTTLSDNLQIPTFNESANQLKIRDNSTNPILSSHVNTFTGKFIHSLYVPPGVEVTAYVTDPSISTTNNPYITFPSNTLIIDTCYQSLVLSDGSSFFTYYNNEPGANYWFNKWLDQSSNSVAALNLSILSSCLNTNIRHRTPFWVIKIVTPFKELLRTTCLTNKPLYIGDHDMREYWYPQSLSCDHIMTEFCHLNPTDSKCACFLQQSKLDEMYHQDLAVPVCCFGHLVSTMSTSCAMKSDAYKTSTMLENCCQHTDCSESIKNCGTVPTKTLATLATIQSKMTKLNVSAQKTYDTAKQLFISKGNVNQSNSTTQTKTITTTEEFTQKPLLAWILIATGVVLCVLAFFITLVYSAYYTSTFDSNQLVLRQL